MPKRKSKGQQRKTNKGPQKRELEYKDDSQEYAQVVQILGNSRFQVQCFDGVVRLGHIRGNMRNKVWIKLSDFVLVSLRDFQDNKCDVIMKYTTEEVRNLKSYGELPETVSLVVENEEEDTSPFDFDDI